VYRNVSANPLLPNPKKPPPKSRFANVNSNSYAIIALAFYVYPDDASGDLGGNFFKSFFGPHS
jgi:hypothetical protein